MTATRTHWRSCTTLVVLLVGSAAFLVHAHPFGVKRMMHRTKITAATPSRKWLIQKMRGGGKGERSAESSSGDDTFSNSGPNHDQSRGNKRPLDNADDDTAELHESVSDEDIAATAIVSDDEGAAPIVGVKSHKHRKNHKKSNAVGDPGGEGSSDGGDDDDDAYLSDWDDLTAVVHGENDYQDMDSVLERVQVEVEYTVEEDDDDDSYSNSNSNSNHRSSAKASTSTGGVGVRLGQRFKKGGKNKKAGQATESNMQRHLLTAWQPHVYLPPPDWSYLREHSRTMDVDGKTRLDRRTLYAGLLIEWGATASSGSSSYRKFVDKDVSQALQAALSLATQPAWRKSLQRPSAVRLYDNEKADRGCTLAMQETIAMAMVRTF
jgi:hypothetical protein